MTIDVTTFQLALAIAMFMQLIALYNQYRKIRQYSGPGWWVLGMGALAVGFGAEPLLNAPALQGVAKLISNSMVMLGVLLVYTGLRRFEGQRENLWMLGLFFAFFVGALAASIFIFNNPDARRVINAGGLALSCLYIALRVFVTKWEALRASLHFLATIFVIFGALLLARALVTLLGLSPIDNQANAPAQLLTYIGTMLASSLWTYGLIALLNQRLHIDNLEARRTLEKIFETIPDVVLVTRVSDGRLVSSNRGFNTLTGYSQSDASGKTPSDLNLWASPQERDLLLAELRKKGAVENFEVSLRNRAGEKHWGLISARVIELGGEAHILSVTRNINELKRAQNDLRESEEKFRMLAENSSDIIWQVDADMRLTYISPADKTLRGFDAEEVLGQTIWQQLKPEGVEAIRQASAQRRQTEADGTRTGTQRYELEQIRKDGSWLWTEINVTPIHNAQGEICGYHGITRDISARKLAENALRENQEALEARVRERTAELQAANASLEKANRLKDEFLASMSHELRTPLTGILGLSDVLLLPGRDPLTEKQRKSLTHIHESGLSLLELINAILDYTRLEAGSLPILPEVCNVAALCHTSMQGLARLSVQKNLHASLSVKPDDLMALADPRRLKQILGILINNAIKFTPEGGRIGIEAAPDPESGQVRITIWDTGIGIPPDDQGRLFQPFVQLDASLARRYPGTGLGLALASRLAQAQGGSIALESAAGRGSRFHLFLPAQREDDKALAGQRVEQRGVK